MKKRDVSFFIWAFERLFYSAFITELIFKAISFSTFFDLSLLRILLFTLAVSLLISALASLLPVKAGKWVVNILMWFFCIYTMVQSGLKSLVGNYLSVRAMGTGAGRITEYVLGFMAALKYRWLLIAPGFVCMFVFNGNPVKTKNRKVLLGSLAASVVLDLAGLGTVYAEGVQSYYRNAQFTEQTIQKFGMERYLLLDLTGGSRSTTLVAENTMAADATASADAEETDERTRQNDIDDSAWRTLAAAESDSDMQQIDQYLLNRNITNYDDHTGMLKGKNVIYIMIEAFSFIAIDPVLTPTLQKIKDEGWYFANHYTPHHAWGTGDSEFISEVSLVPSPTDNTVDNYATNQWPDSIFHQFVRAGYSTQAYHNWRDQYYNRRTLYENSDMQKYENRDDLPYSNVDGWKSDLEMMQLTLSEFIDNPDPWFTLYVTSTTHFPYNTYSYYGDLYLDQIDAVHPEYDINVKRYLSKAMELDKAMEYLIDQLQQHNQLDNTLIVMYADHHPLDTLEPLLHDYVKDVDTSVGLNVDRSPMMMYGAGLSHEEYSFLSSTYDIAPTVMNLLGIEYDPRIYMGRDLFSDSEEFIPFPDGSWITADGIYLMSDGIFTPFEGKENKDDAYIQHYSTLCQNLFSVSDLIFQKDYFAKRKAAAEPVYREEPPSSNADEQSPSPSEETQ